MILQALHNADFRGRQKADLDGGKNMSQSRQCNKNSALQTGRLLLEKMPDCPLGWMVSFFSIPYNNTVGLLQP